MDIRTITGPVPVQRKMAHQNLIHVEVPLQVVEAFMVHALTTEEEEIMGLLFGKITEWNTAQITQIHILTRTDKRKDRVEVSDEQLTSAQQKAEQVDPNLYLLLTFSLAAK